MSTMHRITKLCDGDCGNVYLKTDMTKSCYGDLYCNDCMFDFVCGQMVGDDDPCDY